MNTYPFNGWDWSELARAWNVYMPDSYAGKDLYRYEQEVRNGVRERMKMYKMDGTVYDFEKEFGLKGIQLPEYENFDEWEPLVWYIRTALSRDEDGSGTRVTRKMANDVRAFCLALAEDSHKYHEPLWIGMSKIEHDWTLLWLIIGEYPLLAEMWD